MDFTFSEAQTEIRTAVREALADAVPPSRVRAAWSAPAADLGPTLAEIGVLGLGAPERLGGMGLGPTWWVGVLEEIGWAAVPYPVVELVAALPALEALGEDALIERVLAGEPAVAVADGKLVRHVGDASLLFIVSRASGTVEAARGAVLRPQRPLDGSVPISSIIGYEGSQAGGAVAYVGLFARLALAASAEQLGAARRALAFAVAYAKERQQFGKAIGSFQAVQQLLVDATVGLAFAAPLLHRAAWSIEHDDPEALLHASMARHHVCRASLAACRASLQVHGAIGYTIEYDLQLWMKRVWQLASMWGDEGFHADLVATWLNLEDHDG